MNIQNLRHKTSGFTLVELLVVITIIITLAGLGFVVASGAKLKADKLAAQKTCAELASAIENFKMDNNTFPLENYVAEDGIEMIKTDGERNNLVKILINKEEEADKINNTGKSYFTAEEAKTRGAKGLYINGQETTLTDPWGNPYYVVINTNGEEEVKDPTAEGKGKKLVRKIVIVFSAGQDGEFGTKETNDDNVYSWKSGN